MSIQFEGRVETVGFRGSVGRPVDRAWLRWGGVVGVVGSAFLLASLVVVTAMGLPDASDLETLTTYPDIAAGRIAEHLLYLGALVLFALHVLVLHRVLRRDHPVAASFGAATAVMGLVTMAASSLLHLSTAPLAELYEATAPADRAAVEAAWVGAQSVFDTLLVTGVLLVPVGLLLLGVAMTRSPVVAAPVTWITIGLGTVGVVGALIAIVDPGSMAVALSVFGTVVVVAATGWQLLRLASTRAGLDL